MNSFREKLFETYQNIANKTRRELDEKQKTISELQKLIERQHEIIREQKEHSKVTYIPNREQEEILERLKKEVNRYQEIVRTYEESATKLNAQLEEIILMYQKEEVKYQEVTIQLEKEREKVSSLEREFSKGQAIPEEPKEEIEMKCVPQSRPVVKEDLIEGKHGKNNTKKKYM